MTTHRLDAIALVLNHLLLVGRATTDEDPTEVEVSSLSLRQAAPVLAGFRFEIAERKPRRAPGDGAAGFIVACPLDFEFTKQIAAQPVASISLMSHRRNLGGGTLPVSSLLSPEIQAHADSLRLMSMETASSHPLLFRILASILDGGHKSPTIDAHLDKHLIVPDRAFIASGWAAGVGEHSVAFVLDEFRLAVNPERVLTKLGEDIEGSGSHTSRFTCIDTLVGQNHELRLAAVSGSTVRWSPVLELRTLGSPRALLQAVAQALSYRESLYVISSSGVLQELVQARSEPQATEVLAEHQDAERPPDLSIVIPFYGDGFFLLDHLESQRRADAPAEWIFVCDDPALLPSMLEEWRVRGTGGKPSRLLSLSENAGYAAANNVAFRQARAEYIAFMNSDIFWHSLAPIEYGARLLRDDESVGVVGFTLHYEDGTIQHAGMRLESAPDHDDLLHWVHPGKGLPSKELGREIAAREVQAVTGALMLVRRKDFDGRVFDEGYVGGDYEDGDLCLEMRARGKRIMLVECDGLFHLERQSIRSVPTHGLLSTMNCVRFNRKWDAAGRRRPDRRLADSGVGTRVESSVPRPRPVKAVADGRIPEGVASKCAIHAHIFYPDLVDEVLSYLAADHLAGIDTYVTVVDWKALERITRTIQSTGRKNIRVTRIPNGGRDLAPLFVHHRDLFNRYKYICHLHSKKSPHTDFGDEWRRYLFGACIGSAATVAAILTRLEADPKLAVAFPDTFPKIAPFTNVEFNKDRIEALLKRLNSEWKYESVEYPAGSMCWIRTDAFRHVIGKMPEFAEIEAEKGQVDMTWAHAMERCLTLIPKLSGFTHCSYPAGGYAR